MRRLKVFSYHDLTREVGATALPKAGRPTRKRKASESDNITANDEAATIDEKKIVGVQRVGEKARGPKQSYFWYRC